MARGEIKIPMAVDTSGIQKEIDNGLVKPLDKAEDALKALEKVDAGKDLERDLEKASKATRELDDDLDDTRKSLQRLGFASKKIDDDTKSGFGKASENVEEFKNEAAQNFSEVTSSFDGSMDSILDLAQGTLGGLASGISGPLGIALGVAAAGIGLVVNGLVEGEEKAEELREQARQFAIEAVNAGSSTQDWLTGAEQIVERIQELEQLKSTDWRWFWEKDPTQLQKWTDGLKDSGRSLEEVEAFLGSSADAQDDYIQAVKRSQEALHDEIQLRRESVDITNEAEVAKTQALVDEYEAGQDVLDMLGQEVTLREEASSSAERQRDAGVDSARARIEAEEEAAERLQAAQDAIVAAQDAVEASTLSSYDSMRSAAYDKATADDAAFDIGKWLTYVEETRALADTYKSNLAAMKLTPAEWENFLALPEDARQNIAASYQSAGEDGKERIRSALSDTGSTAGNEATVGFEESFQPDAGVTVDVDTAEATEKLEAVAEKRIAEIEVETTGKAKAQEALDSLAADRTATIRARVDLSEAERQIRDFQNRYRTTTVHARVVGGTDWD